MPTPITCLHAFTALLACSALLHGADAARSPAPEDLLKARGLAPVGTLYLLDADARLAEGLRAVRLGKKQEDEYQAKHAALEKQLKTARANIFKWSEEFARAGQQMEKTGKGDVRRYNQLVNLTNTLRDRIREGNRLVEEKEKELAALKSPRGKYLTAVVELAEKMEAAAKQYEALAADPDVKAAVAKLNDKSGPKVRLGPSPAFADELPKMRRLREQVISAPVPITVNGGTARVEVTLNGKVTQTMVVDSGASAVSISWRTAEQCGITPGPADPTVVSTLADGRQVKDKLMVLETVQVGPFVVRHVECLVSSESEGDTPALLGGSFLRHFVVRSDLAAGELHLTQIPGADPKKGTTSQPTITAGPGRTSPGRTGPGFTVPASGAWTPVVFTVEAGKCYEVKAQGKWTGSTGVETGPAGACPQALFHVLGPQPDLAEQQRDLYIGQHPRNALIGRIGSERWSFFVGEECRFLAPVSGQLSFSMNDTASASPQRTGELQVVVTAITPEWIDRKGQAEILARIDDQDRLHITPDGIYWEWGGAWGKVGLHQGTWPTVINGIYWWPRWMADGKRTDPLVVPDLWPRNLADFQVARVTAKRGKVELTERTKSEIVLHFKDGGR
jgi:clan AA aspartic protease (TIGR02281 family)